MERVAERARTGKASVYRRWPSRLELALDAVYAAMPDPASPPDTGSLRGDLVAVLRLNAELLAGPAGEAMRGLLGDALRDPARMSELRRHFHGASSATIGVIVRRAVARGEIVDDAVTARRLEVGPALLRQHYLYDGVPIADRVVLEIVDEVLVPLFTGPPPRLSP